MTAKQAGRAEPMGAAGDGSMDVPRGSLHAAPTISRWEMALRGIFLDIHSSNESTNHPANGVLIDALRSLHGNTYVVQSILATEDYTSEPYSNMFDLWTSKLEKDAEMMYQGEKGRKYMFLLNNTCRVLQIMRRPGPSFSNAELVTRLISMIQRYKKSYITECWVPLNNTRHLNTDDFIAGFFATCDNQRTWKVTAELRYKLREEIMHVTALQENRSERVNGGSKEKRMYASRELEEEIKELFEG